MLDARRAYAARALRTVALLGVGVGCLALLGPSLSEGFCDAANALLRLWTFGQGGHAALVAAPLRAGIDADANATWDATLLLSIDGVPQVQRLLVNPRRLFFLPLVVFSALTFALAPRPGALYRWLFGASMLAAFAVGSLGWTAAWVFMRVPGLVYTPGAAATRLVHLVYEGLVAPPSAKLLLPVALAFALHALSVEARTEPR